MRSIVENDGGVGVREEGGGGGGVELGGGVVEARVSVLRGTEEGVGTGRT